MEGPKLTQLTGNNPNGFPALVALSVSLWPSKESGQRTESIERKG